jgi:hypothetical protein
MPPSGCAPLSGDAACTDAALPPEEDSLNLRCWNQKRRFGFDLLYPLDRYVDGLTQSQVPNSSGQLVPNPLFAARGGQPARHPSRVVLAGIVGVPWQDIAAEESLSSPDTLTFLTAAQLRDQDRWDMILGDPENGVLPTDPLMIETNQPRTGTHPILNQPLAPPTSTNPLANAINGHEVTYLENDDLQYACIFPLAEPRDCSDGSNPSCVCSPDRIANNLPVCKPSGGGASSTTQYYAKVYPSPRHLELLRRLEDNAVVASACPKVVSGNATQPSFGYNPVARALVDQTRALLGGN